MLRKILLPVIFILLAWGFFVSPEFKEVAAGVAIFLVGMMALENGFKAFTGGVLEKVLTRSTDRTWKSLGFGFATTAVMQSSSLVSVLTISFLSAGLIDLAAGIGIIFGSNIGTTTGAWLVAGLGLKVDIAAYAMPMIVFGVIFRFQTTTALKGVGSILAGIGFLFLGIAYMKSGFESAQEGIDLTRFAMTGLLGVLTYTGIGIVATVIMQSSHATLILSIAALAAGQISYENSLAMAIGSNVGTTVTAVLGSLNANAAGKRLAVAHLVFNLITGAIAIVFLSQLAGAVDWISEFVGIEEDSLTLKFAVFHTLFNVIGVTLMTPMIGLLVKTLERRIPEKVPDISMPRYLNESAMELPDTALKAIVLEAIHLYRNAREYMARGLGLSEDETLSDKDLTMVIERAEIEPDLDLEDMYERRIKGLYSAIIEYGSRAEPNMVPAQVELLYHIRLAMRDIVQAAKGVKHMHTNLLQYGASDNADIRAQYDRLRSMIAHILRALDRLSEDREAALERLKALKAEVRAADIVDNGQLDELIRANRISAVMASSLINDNAYAQNVADKLINVASTVSHDRTYDLMRSMRERFESIDPADELPGRDAGANGGPPESTR